MARTPIIAPVPSAMTMIMVGLLCALAFVQVHGKEVSVFKTLRINRNNEANWVDSPFSARRIEDSQMSLDWALNARRAGKSQMHLDKTMVLKRSIAGIATTTTTTTTAPTQAYGGILSHAFIGLVVGTATVVVAYLFKRKAVQCVDMICDNFRPPENHGLQRHEFQQTVAFLASVPFFRTQLPRSELPKVARCLTRQIWQPGSRLVHQGEIGRSFFLIQDGTALVTTRAAKDMPEQTRAVLCKGDYFGAQSMTSERPNVASITASGDSKLVTLSMSRAAFDAAELRQVLKFPKRAALQEKDSGEPSGKRTRKAGNKTKQEEIFIRSAIQKNANLCALMHASDAQIQGLVEAAEKRQIKQSDEVAQQGKFSNQFFIVYEGAFEISFQDAEGQQSAEAVVGLSTMAERLARKQHCLQALSQQRASDVKQQSSITVATLSRKNQRRASQPEIRRKSAIGVGEAPAGAGEKPLDRRNSSALAHYDIEDEENSVMHLTEAVPLEVGGSFGELSILYNTPHMGTLRAKENSVVYVIGRQDLMTVLGYGHRRAEEYQTLLDEVPILQPILSTERWEMACRAIGVVDFKPDEQILTQGKPRQALQWYVVSRGGGSQIIDRPGTDGTIERVTLANMSRGSHFGERSLLRGDLCSAINVYAGPEGMSCLTFDGDTIKALLGKVLQETTNLLPSLDMPIEEYITRLEEGWSMHRKHNMDALPETSLERLQMVEVLGKGGFAKVSLVQDVDTKQRYALKAMSKGYVKSQGAERNIRWERELLSMVDTPFITRFYVTLFDEQHIYFVLEATLGGNLADVLHKRPAVFQADSPRGSAGAFYCACIIAALEHMHERCIVHRDVKPENVLLDERGYAKLCDMGFARFVLGKTYTMCGTPEYMAPEMIDFPHGHDVSVDWWSLGALAFELMSGQTPWDDESINDPMTRLLAIRRSQEKHQLLFPYHFPQLFKDFVDKLLQKLPQRLGATGGANAIRRHNMFSKLQFDFSALHNQTLVAPYFQEWTPSNSDFFDWNLGLKQSDSIYQHDSFIHDDVWERQFSPQ